MLNLCLIVKLPAIEHAGSFLQSTHHLILSNLERVELELIEFHDQIIKLLRGDVDDVIGNEVLKFILCPKAIMILVMTIENVSNSDISTP
jgi:hypothetical protein